MSHGPLVSVIINNYNYGRYLGEAIDSALKQSYPCMEVIVVDDGSTDNSREIIASYGRQVIPVLKENGGQASAFNAGFAVSRGDIVCFLDSDDVFLPNKIEKVVKARQRYPDAVLYYHQMRVINSEGKFKGRRWPLNLWAGLIQERVEKSGGYWPRPVTSALCFARSYLQLVLPMPVDGFRLCADAYLGDLAPFCGAVAGVPEVLSLYRRHNQNNFDSLATDNQDVLRKKIEQHIFEYEQLKKALVKLGIRTSIALEHHLPYLLCTYNLYRKPGFWQMVWLILSYPTLGFGGRMYRLLKLIIKQV